MIWKRLKEICLNVREKIFGSYASCYEEQEERGYAIFGMCGGLAGGTDLTDYLSESCVECPYLRMQNESSEKITFSYNSRHFPTV